MVRDSLVDQVARNLLELIRLQGFKTGDRLPSTKELARRYQVGYPTLREALTKLETVGIIRLRHGAGIFVENVSRSLIVASPLADELSSQTLLDLIDARLAIEPSIAAQCAMRITDEQVEKLEACLAEARKDLQEDGVPSKIDKINLRFHELVAEFSGNIVFAQIMRSLANIYSREQASIHQLYGLHGARIRGLDRHAAIFECIRDRDPECARRAMEADIMSVREAVLERGQDSKEVLPVD